MNNVLNQPKHQSEVARMKSPSRMVLGQTTISLAIATMAGLVAFLYPFLVPGLQQSSDDTVAHAGAAPYLFAGVVIVVLVVTLASISGEAVGVERSRRIALLGVLVAIDATLRLVPSLAGASPVFLLIMLVGAVFGPSLGFQMGALTLLLSAFITGGIGPWLPFQMLVSAWVGMTAGFLPRSQSLQLRIGVLAIFGAVWGLAFGALMNLWFWPYTAPGIGAESGLYWYPGLSALEALHRYVRFYMVTSLPFDAFRAVGNIVLVLLLAAPIIKLLERYRSRFEWQPWEESA